MLVLIQPLSVQRSSWHRTASAKMNLGPIRYMTNNYSIAARRALSFSADLILLLLIFSFVMILLGLLLPLDISTKPNLAWLIMEQYDGPSAIRYAVPIIGIGYIYNRIRAKQFVSTQHETLEFAFLNSWFFVKVSIAVTVLATILIAISGTFLAALGFLGGALIASGAGAAYKGRIVGLINERTQLAVAGISAIAILGASWLASWASISISNYMVHGAYLAPALGVLAGLFIDEADKQVSLEATDINGNPTSESSS